MEEQNQRPLRLLSLDGGGVRGYSMLLLLQEVMHKLFVEIEGRAPEKWEIPRPCDHFDLIGGTGTGGLIAVLLGRLRLDIATALEIYVDMTRYIFEEEKTVGGIPYGKTLYKASKLEEATKEVVSKYESKDTRDHRRKPPSPVFASSWTINSRRMKRSHTLPAILLGTSSPTPSISENSWTPQHIDAQVGQEALWYDERPGRCKTFVTAVYKGSRPSSPPAILRTFESASESCPVGHICTIWEASRATCAVFPAFKPIQIGQSVFMDEGRGSRFNPSLLVLEEATVNEWPGREIGVFLSIGSGKLPSHMETPPLGAGAPKPQSSSFRESIIGVTPLQKFVEARENHKAKIGECEQIHLDTLRKMKECGLNDEAYLRLNVDEGVGDKGMAEFARLADISNGTRTYLAKSGVQRINKSAARRLADIWRQMHEIKHKVPARVPVPTGSSTGTVTEPPLPPLPTHPLPNHLVSQPIVPNLAFEFGRLNPSPQLSTSPYNNSEHSSSGSGIAVTTDSKIDITAPHQQQQPQRQQTPILVSRRPAPAPTPPTSTTRIPSAPLDSRLPLHQPRASPDPEYIPILPLYESVTVPVPMTSTAANNMTGGYNPGFGFLNGTHGSTHSLTYSHPKTPGDVGLGIDMHRMTMGVGMGTGVGVDPVSSSNIRTGSVTGGHGGFEEDDEEVALHFRELQRIAGKIEQEAMWANHGRQRRAATTSGGYNY